MTAGGGWSSDCRSTREIICDAGAGAASGAIAATFVCPLDVIKTRLQVHGIPEVRHSGPKVSIIITSLQNIIRTECLKGMYRGLSPTLAPLLPNWAVYFTTYGYLKGLLHSHVDSSGQLTFGATMIAASGTGAATAIATNPLWVVKTRLQTQGMRPGVVPYKGICSALRRIAYEEDNTTTDKLSAGEVAIASAISKIVASIMTYPHELISLGMSSKILKEALIQQKEIQEEAEEKNPNHLVFAEEQPTASASDEEDIDEFGGFSETRSQFDNYEEEIDDERLLEAFMSTDHVDY